ncbi:hypothetical protein fugu_008063 [Takifugu bimaculatus]|uniref:Uncharacterized protein n=1 Tax=Takifugu bimaculatus TaxID=433685 RepID=A0A4Z2B0A7_9TELE|nr:hypothetical protein fugu_008063 [Takifugu bimaculatus]
MALIRGRLNTLLLFSCVFFIGWFTEIYQSTGKPQSIHIAVSVCVFAVAVLLPWRRCVVERSHCVACVCSQSTLSQSIKQLQRTSSDLPVKVTNILSAIDAAEYLIAHNASHVVKQETRGYMQSLVGYFRQYTQWVKNSLSGEVAPCKPISNMVDSMEIVACSFIIDSVNTFWFGLGGCSILLIPSIIFSIKLAKYYRRMDTEDVFEDGQEGWN